MKNALESRCQSSKSEDREPEDTFSLIAEKRLSPLARILGIWLIAWLPIALLELWFRVQTGSFPQIPLLLNLAVATRLLIAIPLLVLFERPIDSDVRNVIAQFRRSQLIDESRPEFEKVLSRISRLIRSKVPDILLLLILGLCLIIVPIQGISNVEGTPASHLWYKWVSVTFFRFFLLRWTWRYFVWAILLQKISRLQLKLSPSHADQIGGLGFMMGGHQSFARILAPLSLVMASTCAYRILIFHENLKANEAALSSFVFIGLFLFFLPLFFWAPTMLKSRRQGLRKYGAFVYLYNSIFEAKWMPSQGSAVSENPLGASDIQSLADLGNAFQRVEAMRVIPITNMALRMAVTSIVVPLLPLALLVIPVSEVLRTVITALWN